MLSKKIYDSYKTMLSNEGLKFTPQRLEILEEIVLGEGHRECEEIYLSMKKKGKSVSRATVYRTIDLLVKNNLVRKLELGDGRARYESKLNSSHHDHLICIDCGDIVEFVDDEIENKQEEIALNNGFILKKHIHQLFGLCKKCQ
ncbi:MAG: Fur family transcriptional regulator [Candidatus Neomarinimicrobiota bacterium]|nr:Fur family transcriptional regulator [Candidatus Neomarinimicrobiota bacterium]|tara:strand:- start:42 stop:473 length:432 start_codon:yes stop_codon:yes gene_type:complete